MGKVAEGRKALPSVRIPGDEKMFIYALIHSIWTYSAAGVQVVQGFFDPLVKNHDATVFGFHNLFLLALK